MWDQCQGLEVLTLPFERLNLGRISRRSDKGTLFLLITENKEMKLFVGSQTLTSCKITAKPVAVP